MLQNIVDFKAKSFLTERNTSTMAYEVKAVRALWDPSLSIPGTNRRGGWRCPVGTRYGGQITDRFGRSCGWGVARRIANQISDIGQRLENVDDARRGRRIARRERRILQRLNPEGGGAGRLEQGLRGVAERLDGGDAPSPRGARRRTVVARPPSVDAPEKPRELTPARPARNDRNLLEAEPLNVLEEMRDELENATGGRDSDDYKRVMAELKRRNAVARPARPARRRRAPNLRESEQRRMEREIEQPGAPRTGEAPARPARRRQPARPRGEGNLRESEQRRMDREIEQPGAPRTGEVPARPARRRRRAVVETSKTPKAPTQQEARPKPQIEPKVVKPRRPRKNPEGDIGAMLDAESEQRRVPKPAPRKGVDVGKVPQGFREVSEGRWESRDWRVQLNVDRNGNPVGLTAQSQLRPRQTVSGKDWDELVAKINRAERIHAELQRGDNDNAARSAEIRAEAARRANSILADADRERAREKGKEVDLDKILELNERLSFVQYMHSRVVDEQRLDIINDSDNFPSDRFRLDIKAGEAKSRIIDADARLERIQNAINSGLLQENDYIQLRKTGVNAFRKVKVSELKALISSHRDGWQEVLDQIGSYGGPNAPKKNEANRNRAEMNELLVEREQAQRDINILERRGARDADIRKVQRRIDEINNRLASFQEMPPEAAPETSKTPETPKRPDVPKALKFEQQVADVAKLSPENQAAVEQGLLEITNPQNLANFVLAADAHIFNENEGRQGAIRDFNDLILRELEKYEQNPQQYGDLKRKIEELQRTYYRSLNRNLGTKVEVENKLRQLKSEQQRYWALVANPTGDTDAQKESMRLQAMIQLSEVQGQVGKYEQGLKIAEKIEAEIAKGIQRKEQGMFFNPDAANVVKPLDEDVARKIKSQIDVAIKRRQGKLAKYLKKRDPNNTAKYVDMTKAKFDALPNSEKIAYIQEAYGHPRIEGANGKLYSATARVSGQGRTFSVSVVFHEIDKDGNKLRQVGTSERSISSSSVYNASMFIGSQLDRGADIQTIYNQHAFLYLKKMGITKAGVTAAQDGQYVWPRIGFKQGSPLRSVDLSPLQKELKFFEKFGAGGLISSEAEYMRIKSILKQARDGKTFSHQEIIFAIDDPVGNKPRGEFVKQWFISNMRSSGGNLSFAEQKIGDPMAMATRAPRRRNPR